MTSSFTKLGQFVAMLAALLLPALLLTTTLIGWAALGWDWRLLFLTPVPLLLFIAGDLLVSTIKLGIGAAREERYVRQQAKLGLQSFERRR